MSLRGRTLAVLALVLALTVTTAGAALAQTQQPPQAILRVVHAVPGAQAVDVFVDGNLVFSNIAFGQATNYAALTAGGHTVRVVPAGAGAQGQALIDTPVELAGGSYNTVAAVGRPNSIQALPLVNSSTLPVTNQALVRVVHASPDAPPVDVAVQGGQVLFSNVGFPSASGYITVPAGTVNLEIRQAGTSNVVRSVPNVTLNGATVYSIFAIGLLNGQPSLSALPVVDAPPIQTCQTLVGAAAQATGTPSVTGTPQTATPTTTGTPATATPTASGTPRTATPTTTGTPATATPTVSGTPRTGTPTTTGTPRTGTPTVATRTPTTGVTPTTGMTPPAGTPPSGVTPPAGAGTPGAAATPGGPGTLPTTPQAFAPDLFGANLRLNP